MSPQPATCSPLEALETRQLMAAGPLLPQTAPLFGPDQYAFADFNNDGNADLATLRDGRVRVGLGDGDGAFEPAPRLGFRVPDFQRTLAAGDFNGDGRTDIVVVNSLDSGKATFAVLLNDGQW